MKTLFLGITSVVIVGLAVWGFRTGKTGSPESPTPTVVANPIVSVIAATVSLKNPGDSDFNTITQDTSIVVGSEIKTSKTGRAKISYPNGTRTIITEDSQVTVTELADGGNKSRLTLVVGEIVSKIKNVLGTGQYYEVQTENVVASVRGTTFATQFRNRISKVYGLEHKVAVQSRDPKSGSLIAGAVINVASGEKTSINSTTVPRTAAAMAKAKLTDEDLRSSFIKTGVGELDKNDTEDKEFQKVIERLRDKNLDDKEFINRIKERKLIQDIESPSPSAKPSPTTSVKPSPSPSASLRLLPSVSVTPRPTPTTVNNGTVATPSPTPTPEPTLDTSPVLEFIYPKQIAPGGKITVNGRYFTSSNLNTKFITQVSVGGKPVSFSTLDSLTIFATIPTDFAPGLYDVTLTTTTQKQLNLPNALQVQ